MPFKDKTVQFRSDFQTLKYSLHLATLQEASSLMTFSTVHKLHKESYPVLFYSIKLKIERENHFSVIYAS